MSKERKVSKSIIDFNMFDVEVHHNGYRGGDAGHGGFLNVSFKNFESTHLNVTVKGGGVSQIHHLHPDGPALVFNQPDSILLNFKGDAERDTFIEALEFIINELKGNVKMGPNVETVSRIYSTGASANHKGIVFEHYVVYLEGYEEPFNMSKVQVKDWDFVPRVGDKITCEFDGDRIRQVKLLMEHNPDN